MSSRRGSSSRRSGACGSGAGGPQLFVVVRGRGWVRSGEDAKRVCLDDGQAVLFEPDEWMTVVVLEGESLEPAQRGSDPGAKA